MTQTKETGTQTFQLYIDGEPIEWDDVTTGSYLPTLSEGRCEYYVAESSDSAGEAAAEYWRDMACHDRREFACIIGETRLVQWALGESDSFGISSLDDFLEVTATVPEEQWAGYDFSERKVTHDKLPDFDDAEAMASLTAEQVAQAERLRDLFDELGFTPTVAYRHN